jgi:hypothetical protein
MGISWAILNNPVVRWFLIVASVFIGVKIYGEKRERDGRVAERRRVINQIEEQTDERIEQGRAARRDVEQRSDDERVRERAADPNNRLRLP